MRTKILIEFDMRTSGDRVARCKERGPGGEAPGRKKQCLRMVSAKFEKVVTPNPSHSKSESENWQSEVDRYPHKLYDVILTKY